MQLQYILDKLPAKHCAKVLISNLLKFIFEDDEIR